MDGWTLVCKCTTMHDLISIFLGQLTHDTSHSHQAHKTSILRQWANGDLILFNLNNSYLYLIFKTITSLLGIKPGLAVRVVYNDKT